MLEVGKKTMLWERCAGMTLLLASAPSLATLCYWRVCNRTMIALCSFSGSWRSQGFHKLDLDCPMLNILT